MVPPDFSALFAKLKLQLKADFGFAAERLRMAPSREKLAHQVFKLIGQSENHFQSRHIPLHELHGRIEQGLIQKNWPDQTTGKISESLKQLMDKLIVSAEQGERAFRLDLVKLQKEQPEDVQYILAHLKDVSKTHAQVTAELNRELTHNSLVFRHPPFNR